MVRRRRPHLPGATFHLTARTQGREALFVPSVRTGIVEIIRELVVFSDAQLFAYVIMPNHLHLILRQGQQPLWRFMQPLLRKAALLAQRTHGIEGHIFERRFRDHICGDPEYIRNAIVYTHLNPVRSELCTDPNEYHWSSHGAWIGETSTTDGLTYPVSIELASQLFATTRSRDSGQLSEDYLSFLNWRRECDALGVSDQATEKTSTSLPPRPNVGYGDESWVLNIAPGTRLAGQPPLGYPNSSFRLDLENIARDVARSRKWGLDLELIRSRWGGPAYSYARREIILRATAAGYRGVEIAAFLRVTANTVYAVLAAERRRKLSNL